MDKIAAIQFLELDIAMLEEEDSKLFGYGIKRGFLSDRIEAEKMALEALKNERDSGHWIKEGEHGENSVCSVCGVTDSTNYDEAIEIMEYCPYCGAKMELWRKDGRG